MIQKRSTRSRVLEMTATGFALRLHISPPSYATISRGRSTPSSFSKFVLASANASLRDMPSGPASNDAYVMDVSLHRLPDKTRRTLTHAMSNRVLRALQDSSMPMPTVTLCSSRTEMADFSVSGGPGSLQHDS